MNQGLLYNANPVDVHVLAIHCWFSVLEPRYSLCVAKGPVKGSPLNFWKKEDQEGILEEKEDIQRNSLPETREQIHAFRRFKSWKQRVHLTRNPCPLI